MKVQWLALAPMMLLAGCSSQNGNAPTSASQPPASAQAVAQPAAVQPAPASTPAANPEPVASPPAALAEPARVENAPPARPPHIDPRMPDGTIVSVRLNRTIDTQRNRAGDPFSASLSRPLHLPGGVTLPRGTRFRGHVTTADSSGRLKGRAVLAVTLDSFESGGREYRIRTSEVERVGNAHKKRNTELIGGGAGLGAIVGAIAGGGKGAAIGALAGAGAGTAGAAATGKLNVAIPAEAALVFRVR